ncbi:hypothetical protein RJT34_17639 [Clitoria ternatea]|uniref:Uncharacterized protein n=1 Tax=Clitoria ternatea TaxID=43366 RepID=A0AAN9J9Q1_CLITE
MMSCDAAVVVITSARCCYYCGLFDHVEECDRDFGEEGLAFEHRGKSRLLMTRLWFHENGEDGGCCLLLCHGSLRTWNAESFRRHLEAIEFQRFRRCSNRAIDHMASFAIIHLFHVWVDELLQEFIHVGLEEFPGISSLC